MTGAVMKWKIIGGREARSCYGFWVRENQEKAGCRGCGKGARVDMDTGSDSRGIVVGDTRHGGSFVGSGLDDIVSCDGRLVRGVGDASGMT